MIKSFLNRNFTKWDIFSITLFSVLTIIITLFREKFYTEQGAYVFLAFSVVTYLFLIIFNYKSLRSIWVFLAWITLAISQLFLYKLMLQEFIELDLNIVLIRGFRNLWLFLIAFQLFRVLSIIAQEKDLVVPFRGMSKDFWQEREYNIADTFLASILIVICAVLYAF